MSVPPTGAVSAGAPYVLIPGAGGRAWDWHLVVAELRRRGRNAIAVDLPAGDDSAGLSEYADTVADAIGDRTGAVLVAHSLGACTAPLVWERASIALIVLVNGMVMAPGESPGEWWGNTRQAKARADDAARYGRPLGSADDLTEDFFHDLPSDIRAAVMAMPEPAQSATPMASPWPLDRWPDVPVRVLVGRDDRFLPPDFQRRVALQRLGITPDEMPGGHLVPLSRPCHLVDLLEAYRAELT